MSDKIPHENPNCPRWPRCSCIVQGYVNRFEKNHCGRKPTTYAADQRRALIESGFRWNGRKKYWEWTLRD